MRIRSKNVYRETYCYFTGKVPSDAAQEVKDHLYKELEVYREHYYGENAHELPIEVFDITMHNGKRWTVMRFSAEYSSSGLDWNPLVFDDIVDVDSLIKE